MKSYLQKIMAAGLLVAGLSQAAVILPGGFIAPEVTAEAVQVDPAPYYKIRGSVEVYVSPDANGVLEADIANSQVGHYEAQTNCYLYALDGRQLQKMHLALKERKVLRQAGLPQGVYRLRVESGQNAALIRAQKGSCSVQASGTVQFAPSYHCPKVFFNVSSGRLKLTYRGDSGVEHVATTIWDATGKVVYEGNTVGAPRLTVNVDIPIPADQENTIWSLKMGEVPGKGFEDMHLTINEGAVPVVAMRPDGLVFPLARLQATASADKKQCQNNLLLASQLQTIPGLTVDMAFSSNGEGIPFQINKSWKTGDRQLAFGVLSAYSELVSGQVKAVFRQGGKVLHEQTWGFTCCEGVSFTEVPWSENGQAAPITAADRARGYQVFQRSEPGFVRPTARPTAAELCDCVKAETSPGLVSAEFVAVLPLRGMASAAVTVGELKAETGAVIPASAVSVLAARIWSQRTDWNARSFIRAPELLEHRETVNLQAMLPQQYCLRTAVPKTAAPGVYRAPILLNGEPLATYELTVDEFILPEYHDMTFGLYADGERWYARRFSDEEYLRELRMFRAYGMNALMVYPFTGSVVKFADGKWSLDFGVFRHQMNLYKREGFDGVLVISLQALRPHLERALKAAGRPVNGPEYQAGFIAVLENIKNMADEDRWPRYCLHTIDEPHTDELGKIAAETLGIVKKHGGKTFNTCYGNIVRKYLSRCLDYRCFNCIAFMSCSSEEKTAKLRQETLGDGAEFWWYGSGCYTNGGLQQDCNIYSNRHMLGVFNWRSKATGAWTWTFLRAKGNVYNDFDANGTFEAKEACICYPAADGKTLIDTLQWEGCREGIYDYRYLRLWDELAAKAEHTAGQAELAAASRRRVMAAVNAFSWTCNQFAVSNGQLRDLRALLIDEIKALRKAAR